MRKFMSESCHSESEEKTRISINDPSGTFADLLQEDGQLHTHCTHTHPHTVQSRRDLVQCTLQTFTAQVAQQPACVAGSH